MGLVGALAAQLFTRLLDLCSRVILRGVAGYASPGLPWEGGVLAETIGHSGRWLIPLATATGGLLVGILTRNFAPEAEGHGTDTVVKAFHRAGGLLRPVVAPVKLLASALTIGSGGSGGREGPVALVSAGVGSWYATITQRSESDRRLLLLIGMAA
ncbi:MAG TPA: chloride channel protein, partial [Gemmatimonadales bacterium]|nr:chloride channel protein [Gemmatimonadales bacterium]